MRIIKVIALFTLFSSCHYNVGVVKRYQLYFDDSSYQMLQNGIEAYQNGKYKLADSLLTRVIDKSKAKLSITMPVEFNPYFYRSSNSIELDKYEQALFDMDHVAGDTTTNTHILLVRSEAFRSLKKYDTSISICNKLLSLKYDSLTILSQRGICYYQKGDMTNACKDLEYCKKLGADTSFLNKFLIACK